MNGSMDRPNFIGSFYTSPNYLKTEWRFKNVK